MRLLIYIMVFGSGFTGLVYQVTWQKYLSFYLGSHAFASAVILSIFFLFLSLGYLVIGRIAHRLVKNQILLYGIIEGLIGVYCLFSPQFFQYLSENFPVYASSTFGEIFLGLSFCSLFIGIPTFLMGGTIPVLTQGLTSQFETSHRIHALIYGLNTLGAVIGTILAGFVFIDLFGLPLTLLYTSFINIFIGFISYGIYKKEPYGYSGIEPQRTGLSEHIPVKKQVILYLISFFSGFYVFSLETILIRMAGISIGSSAYTFSIIVASFILAIAAGSFVVTALKKISGLEVYLYVQIALLLSAIWLYFNIPSWPEIFLQVSNIFYKSLTTIYFYHAATLITFAVILLIPVGLMGMNIPLLFHFLKSSRQDMSTVVGRIYSVNTLGSAFGATLGGYAVFYYLDGPQTFKLNLILIAITIALIASLVLTDSKKKWFTYGGTTIAAILILFLTPWSKKSFSPPIYSIKNFKKNETSSSVALQRIRNQKRNSESLFYQYGPDALVTVERIGKTKSLYVNGNPNTSNSDMWVRGFNAIMPMSLVEEPKSAFVIGLGAGLSTNMLYKDRNIEHVEVAEIAKGVIDAVSLFDDQNYNFSKVKDDVKIHHADAYRVLKATDRKYDIIVCEPAHLWVSGVENLYSKDFLEVVKSKLTEEGVFTQWIPLYASNPEILLVTLNTFRSVFPWTTVWSPASGVFALTGSKSDPNPSEERLVEVFEDQSEFLDQFDIENPFIILGLQLLTPFGVDNLLANVEGRHSLEFPVIGKKSARQSFIDNFVDLSKLLFEHMDRPHLTDYNNDNLHFVYQKFRKKLNKENFYQPLSEMRYLAKPIQYRVQVSHDIYFRTKPIRLNKKTKKLVRFLLDADPDPDTLTRDNYTDKEIGKYFDVFGQLYIAQFPVNWKSMGLFFPEKCKSDQCFTLKKVVASGILNREIRFEIDQESSKKEIEQIFIQAMGSV